MTVNKSQHNDFNVKRINKVKVEMALNDHTKSHLASLMGINRYSLSRKLSQESQFTVMELEKLAEIYEKERTYFF